ncbi:MAG: C39 family peptidase [Oscillatoriophycideae cyanobacterium NC_groundwater_1537_Pr4_S-0.65um_50_18]|nr:C39 family peptidase [Oscillatoriophycideae cyanobacterium NC_groundwater_1537_Pr4_S-0.65um_50_18]
MTIAASPVTIAVSPVDIAVPYFSQRDNKFNPSGACNVTSVAMCLYHLGIRGDDSQKQLEDQMYHRCTQNDWSRHRPEGLKKLIESYGIKDDLLLNATLSDIRLALDKGQTCIVHGYFTGFGHVIVIRGYDAKNFYVNDPWGEWYPWGYFNDVSGEKLKYSNRAIASCCQSFSYGEAQDRYARSTDQTLESMNFMWLHRVSR